MPGTFPSAEWLMQFKEKLNNDPHYSQVAKDWEGDMNFVIEPAGPVTDTIKMYLDLWHGTCRDAFIVDGDASHKDAAFTLAAPYTNFVRILKGEMDPIQAMLTRKLKVQGNMAYMLRHVPTIMDFVRCLREVTDDYLE